MQVKWKEINKTGGYRKWLKNGLAKNFLFWIGFWNQFQVDTTNIPIATGLVLIRGSF